MKKFGIIFWFFVVFTACGKIENSNSLDEILYAPFVDTGSPNYLIAKAAINSNCLQCHGVWRRYTEQEFIDNGLVVRGSSTDSKLYARNLFATSGGGLRNMPTSGYAPISPADLTAMESWINAL
jgi:hypothetical protein